MDTGDGKFYSYPSLWVAAVYADPLATDIVSRGDFKPNPLHRSQLFMIGLRNIITLQDQIFKVSTSMTEKPHSGKTKSPYKKADRKVWANLKDRGKLHLDVESFFHTKKPAQSSIR